MFQRGARRAKCRRITSIVPLLSLSSWLKLARESWIGWVVGAKRFTHSGGMKNLRLRLNFLSTACTIFGRDGTRPNQHYRSATSHTDTAAQGRFLNYPKRI